MVNVADICRSGMFRRDSRRSRVDILLKDEKVHYAVTPEQTILSGLALCSAVQNINARDKHLTEGSRSSRLFKSQYR